MKNLLQNKKFRTNLYKWFSMYICVMAIFTTVVTYSKYISNMGTDEEARVANFEVGISFDCDPGNVTVNPNLDNTSSHVCDMGTSRPTSILPYRFTVDTSKLEADATLVLSILVDKSFELLEIKNITKNITYVTNGTVVPNTGTSIGLKNGHTSVTLTQDVFAKKGESDQYEIKVRYKDALVSDPTGDAFHDGLEVIKVGYAATQKTK